MSEKKRKTFSAQQKAKVAIEAIRGIKTVSERLYSEIGRLKMELDWLKKSQGCARENT